MRDLLLFRLLLLGLAMLPHACYAEEPAELEKEDLRAVQDVLKKGDASLDWFHAVDKKPVDAVYSVVVAEVAPTELRPGTSERVPVREMKKMGIFIVSGRENRVRQTLDTYLLNSKAGYLTLEDPTAHLVYVHFYSDTGFYFGSFKYVYDLSSRRPPQKIRYGILALTSAVRQNGELLYTASFGETGQVQAGWSERHAIITIQNRGRGAAPAYTIMDAPALQQDYSAQEPAPLRAADGETVYIENKTPPGQPEAPSGISVIDKLGKKQFYQVPVPTRALQRKMLPRKQILREIHNGIGPFVFDAAPGANRIWFANTFYDGEGFSGVGAVGTFDISTREYNMRYLPEIAPWSGSAMLLDGDDLWIGLVERPEGADYGEALLRYNVKTGVVARYAVTDHIHTIDRLGDTIYCGTSHGLYTVRGNTVTHLRFEPDEKGKLVMVSREVR